MEAKNAGHITLHWVVSQNRLREVHSSDKSMNYKDESQFSSESGILCGAQSLKVLWGSTVRTIPDATAHHSQVLWRVFLLWFFFVSYRVNTNIYLLPTWYSYSISIVVTSRHICNAIVYVIIVVGRAKVDLLVILPSFANFTRRLLVKNDIFSLFFSYKLASYSVIFFGIGRATRSH